MWISLCWAAALLCVAVLPAWAQTAKPTGAEAAAEAAAAMERAQRLAANPMRVILQAGKIRRKPAEPEAPPEAADATALRRTAARSGADPLVVAASSTAAAVATTAVRPLSPEAAAPAPAPTPLVLQASPLSAPAAAVAGLESSTPAAVPVALPKMALPETLLVARPAQPTLVFTVEPEIPTRLLQESGRVSEIQVDLSLRADGTVANVQPLPPFPRAWQRYIVAALEQWRFEPLVGSRVHRVQLVFTEP